MTASAMKEDALKIEAAFDGYLSKPLKKKLLFHELQKHLPWKTQIKSQAEKDELPFPGKADSISEELKPRLPELTDILEKEFIPKWKEIQDVFFLDDIAGFAEELKN